LATHFSTIGLPINTDEELMDCVNRVFPQSESIPTGVGTYMRWADPSGAELWLQLNAENELIGVNPHFGGRSRVRVLLTHPIDVGSQSPLDGRFHGWADPAKAQAEQSGAYPFLFDAPDAACHAGIEMPSELDVQVAAFAHEIQVYPNPKAFDASRTGDGWHTSQDFMPSGLMGAQHGMRAEAAFTGHILRVERRTNQFSGGEFVWALVNSTGGTFDVVADVELMPTLPPVGGVITGTFWLTGRIGGCTQSTQILASEGWKKQARISR
jgi:hypothetical protein